MTPSTSCPATATCAGLSIAFRATTWALAWAALAPAALAQGNGCPPAGARFERPSSLGGTIFVATGERYGFPVSGSRASDNNVACKFTVEGKETFATLKSSDAPLDAVPRTRSGQCPIGQIARYQFTAISTHEDTIMAGPDSVGRCQLKSSAGRLSWMYANEFELAAASAAAPQPKSPAVGSVWACTLPGIGLFTGANFGIVDSRQFRDHEGRRGSYVYDEKSGILRLTHSRGQVISYQRQSEKNFRVLDDQGRLTGGNCVWNQSKRIEGRW